jgi:hypothetical protein
VLSVIAPAPETRDPVHPVEKTPSVFLGLVMYPSNPGPECLLRIALHLRRQ